MRKKWEKNKKNLQSASAPFFSKILATSVREWRTALCNGVDPFLSFALIAIPIKFLKNFFFIEIINYLLFLILLFIILLLLLLYFFITSRN